MERGLLVLRQILFFLLTKNGAPVAYDFKAGQVGCRGMLDVALSLDLPEPMKVVVDGLI